ncbi:hypothetical protein [Halostreptopolyspora alba]|uniref:Linalool dehydratase/isomerase domain-containing protein n=1 Tax=Halostreptopolyspora alba TaxID=2487137 RepID=A0A3N0E3L9_9ACTN|nr:hypothetical protein EFW17_19225 [Nocardiopsaceae bacterium YIM 96095]
MAFLRSGTRRVPVPRWRVVLAAALGLVALAATGLVAVSTARSYTPSPLERGDDEVAADALPRLEFLRAELRDGAGERMQRLFPEGYVFTHALYGLSWVNVGTLRPGERDRALREARWALERLEAPAGTAPFPEEADPPYGVFHAGWTAWLRGRIVALAGGPENAAAEAEALRVDTVELRAAFDTALEEGTPYLTAYPGQAWPVDSVVAVAALRQDDRLRGTDGHESTVRRWSRAVGDRLDPDTGLIPHSVDAATGEATEGARGSSQSLLLRFLAEIDPEWAARDYRAFRSRFGSDVGVVPGIREHPVGDDSPGDVDSGPLVLGLSASASAVTLGDAVLFADEPTAADLTGLAEAAGMAVELGGRRRYLGGALPVGDAFLVWSLTAGGEHAAVDPDPSGADPVWWRLPWHLATVVVLALLWFALARAVRAARCGRPGTAVAGAEAR